MRAYGMFFLFHVEYRAVLERPLGHVGLGRVVFEIGPEGVDVGQLDGVPEIINRRGDDCALADGSGGRNGHCVINCQPGSSRGQVKVTGCGIQCR